MKKASLDALKRFPIVEFLAALNYVPAFKWGKEHYFVSPVRNENTASLSVNSRKNCWYDHGIGKGGNLIDLAMQVFDRDFKTTLDRLVQITGPPDLQPAPDERAIARNAGAWVPGVATAEQVTAWGKGQLVGATPTSTKRLVRKGELKNGILTAYLVSRGIEIEAVRRCGPVWEALREVHYWDNKTGRATPNFALGLRNEAGGYELFAKNFKSHLYAKSFTFIPGTKPGVAIFEGVMDLLSAITHKHKRLKGKSPGIQCSILVLNSATFREASLPYVQAAGSIFYYGDNDAEGVKTADYYRKTCKGQTFYPMNEKYRGYKDYNDWLTKTKPAKPLPARGQAPSRRACTAKQWLWALLRDPATGKETQCTFYAYNHTPAAQARLDGLHHRLVNACVTRLCTRTSGRGFTYVQRVGATGAVSPQALPRPGQCAVLPAGNPGSWGRPGTAPPAPPERPAGA